MKKNEYPSKSLIDRVGKAKKILEEELDREPSTEEISKYLGEEECDVRRASKFALGEDDEEIEYDGENKLKFKLTIKNYEMERNRKRLNLSQEELAKTIGVCKELITGLENCTVYSTEETREKIAKLFGVSSSWLFPEWLKTFSRKWKRQEHSKVVPINRIQLNNPEVLFLEDNEYGQEYIEKKTEMSIYGKHIKEALENLSIKERGILKMRHGLDDGVSHTLEEVAKEFGATRERIRQVEAKAHEKIRQMDLIKKLQ